MILLLSATDNIPLTLIINVDRTSDTSVYDSINGRVRVHSNGTSADGHSVNYLRVWRLVLNSSYAYGLPGLFKLWRFGKFVDCK